MVWTFEKEFPIQAAFPVAVVKIACAVLFQKTFEKWASPLMSWLNSKRLWLLLFHFSIRIDVDKNVGIKLLESSIFFNVKNHYLLDRFQMDFFVCRKRKMIYYCGFSNEDIIDQYVNFFALENKNQQFLCYTFYLVIWDKKV